MKDESANLVTKPSARMQRTAPVPPASSPQPNDSEEGATQHPAPGYSIHKHISFWHLTFNGQKAVFDHEQGAYYVAYLLLNPPDEPIHGMALEIKSLAYFGQFLKCPGVTDIVNPSTGETMILACDAIFEQRN